MNAESDEAKLKKLFHELKASDERKAPSFARTWQAAVSRATEERRSARWLAPVAVAAALAIIVTALGVVFLPRTGQQQTAPQASLTQWQSPTAFLLTTTDNTLLTSVPSLDQSWMQDMSYLTKNIE